MTSYNDIIYALEKITPIKLEDDGSIRGAVLIPIFEKEGQLYIIFTKRTEDLPTHKGQISFPGGKIEEKDCSLLECALREAEEEIGIASTSIEILGELNQTKTYGSNFLLSVFVGKVTFPFTIVINEDEVDEIIEVPLILFFRDDLWERRIFKEGEVEMPVWYFTYNNHIIWGATAKITREFIELLKQKNR